MYILYNYLSMIWNIEAFRKAKWINQEDVAKKLSIARQTYSKIEKWSVEPTLWQAVKLAELLDVDITKFLNQDIWVKKTENTDWDKYKQIIQFFIEKGTYKNGAIPKTKLAKLCYLADFAWYYLNLDSITGLQYRRIQQWPVPDAFFSMIEEMIESEDISLEVQWWAHLIRNISCIRTEKLSLEEKSLLNKIAKKWKNANTKEIVDFTHAQLPWMMCDEKELIPYHLISQEEPENVY